MSHDNLLRMANRIGDYFQAYPDRAEALEGIANHIEKFWEPRMRRQLLAFLQQHPDGGNPDGITLKPIVVQAVTDHLARLTPAQA